MERKVGSCFTHLSSRSKFSPILFSCVRKAGGYYNAARVCMHMAARKTSEEEGQGQRFEIKFVELERLKSIPEGYRLASVDDLRSDEARQQLTKHRVISQWDIVRLRDGWIEGSGYSNLVPTPRFRPGMGHKLAINRSSPEDKLSVRIRAGAGESSSVRSWIRELLYDCEEGYASSSLTAEEFRDMVRALLGQSSLPVDEETGWTVLHSACMNGDTSFWRDVVMAELRNAGILHHLINKKTSEEMKIDIVYQDSVDEWAPLHVAVTRAFSSDMVELLLENGADPNILDGSGSTPFLLGVQRNDCLPLVKPLLHPMLSSSTSVVLVKVQLKNALPYIVAAKSISDREVADDFLRQILPHLDTDDNIDMYGLMRRVIKNRRVGILNVLLRFLPRLSDETRLSCLRDENGQTLLHHAVIRSRNSRGRRSVDFVIQNYIRPLLDYTDRQHAENSFRYSFTSHGVSDDEHSLSEEAYQRDYLQQPESVRRYVQQRRNEFAHFNLEAYDLFWAKDELFRIAYDYVRYEFDEVQKMLVDGLIGYVDYPATTEKSLQRAARLRKMQLFRQLLKSIVDYEARQNDDYARRDVEDDLLNAQLEDVQWKANLNSQEKVNVMEVWRSHRLEMIFQDKDELEQHVKEGTDQPTPNDILVSQRSRQGSKIRKIIDRIFKSLDPQDKERLKQSNPHIGHPPKENILREFASKYNKRYHSIYINLGLLDILKLLKQEESRLSSSIMRRFRTVWKFLTRTMTTPDSPTKSTTTTTVVMPSILTVHYNAWQYQDENQALAGLANEVIKEIECAMNTAQWLSMCWSNSVSGRQYGRLPILLLSCVALLVFAGLVTWITFALLSSSSNSDVQRVKYGSVTVGIIVYFWAVVRQMYAIVKPISKSLMAKSSRINHEMNLGYHHQVVEDIRFLMKELRRPPSWIWRCLGVFVNMIGENRDYVAGTKIPKQIPSEFLRVIVFVDDLDRCTDDTVFQVLTSINLVLSVCEFNVVLGVDKSVILRVIKERYAKKTVTFMGVPSGITERSEELPMSSNSLHNITQCAVLPEEDHPEDMAERFLEKIVQLPVVLPHPGDKKVEEFLEGQMGFRDKREPRRRTRLPKKVSIRVAVSPTVTDLETEDRSEELDYVDSPREETDDDDGPVEARRLFARYTADECVILKGLQKYMKGEVINPREWKRLLNYHRLAYNIVSQNEEKAVERILDWKAELIVWVFVCWHWKELMNEIIEDWDVLCGELENTSFSLKGIVEAKVNLQRTRGTDARKWGTMRSALQTNDVSMQGIEMFQDFRLLCKQGYLQVPSAIRNVHR